MLGDAHSILALTALTTVGFIAGFCTDAGYVPGDDDESLPGPALTALLDEIHAQRGPAQLPVSSAHSSIPQILYDTDPVDPQAMVLLDANAAAMSILGLDEDDIGQEAVAVFPVFTLPASQPYLRMYQNVGWGIADGGVHAGRVALGTGSMEQAWWFDLSVLPTETKGHVVAEFRPTVPVDCVEIRGSATDALITAECDAHNTMAVNVGDYRTTVYALTRALRDRVDSKAREAPTE